MRYESYFVIRNMSVVGLRDGSYYLLHSPPDMVLYDNFNFDDGWVQGAPPKAHPGDRVWCKGALGIVTEVWWLEGYQYDIQGPDGCERRSKSEHLVVCCD